MSELENAANQLRLLREELANTAARLAALQQQLQDAKSDCEQLRQENKKLKTQRASLVATGGLSMGPDADDDEEPELEAKLSFFLHKTFGLRQQRTVFAREDLQVLALNALLSLHHLDHAPELRHGDLSVTPTTEEANQPDTVFFWKAARVAFNYGLLFAKQLNEECMEEERRAAAGRNFPLQWLLGVFPAKFPADPTDFSNLSWLPLHLFLAANPLSEQSSDVDRYVDDLGLLLDVFGAAAMREDVKPLSIAVSKRTPSLPVVQFLVEQLPEEGIWFEDEDGSIPLMHACANNESTDAVEWLLQRHAADDAPNSTRQRDKALHHADQFGCTAIHYAAFSGRCEMLAYLLQVDAALAQLAESNGALPLHDAVQNQNGPHEQYRMVQLLIEAYPQAAKSRDANGAFPLHLAAKFSNLTVVEVVCAAFPLAVYAADHEGLLPLHYYAARSQREKQEHMLLQTFLLEKNPTSTTYSDEQLVRRQREEAQQAHGASGGVASFVSSWFRSKPAPAPTTPKAVTAASAGGSGKKTRRSSAVKKPHGR
eukprot:gene6641-4786_t